MTNTAPQWLDPAEKELGFHEGPDNDNPFGTFYRIPNQPWCALFVSWCCRTSGHPLPSMQPGMPDGYAGVWYGMQWAKANSFWRPSWEAQPGDAIVYGWDGADSPPTNMHTGLIVSSGKKGSTGHTIEGNRSDQVERQTFVVGADVVLGTIALTKILGPPKARITPKIDPQPRNVDHPRTSGPGTPTKLHAATDRELVDLTARLNTRTRPVLAAGGERERLRAAANAIERVLAITAE
jgi:hypothetical protein